MKFQDMPYKRVDFAEIQNRFQDLMKEFQNAQSGEEQFEIHKKYYSLTDDVETFSTLAEIRHDGDTADAYYKEENDYYDASNIRRCYLIPHTETIWKRRLAMWRLRAWSLRTKDLMKRLSD